MDNYDHFEYAMTFVFKHEGGYVNDPDDPGRETNFGISNKSYPKLNIKDLSKAQALDIYFNDFWMKNNLHLINDKRFSSLILDASVNLGSYTAIRMIQAWLRGVEKDGKMGPQTALAMSLYPDQKKLFENYKASWNYYYESLARRRPRLSKYLLGWKNRVDDHEWE